MEYSRLRQKAARHIAREFWMTHQGIIVDDPQLGRIDIDRLLNNEPSIKNLDLALRHLKAREPYSLIRSLLIHSLTF